MEKLFFPSTNKTNQKSKQITNKEQQQVTHPLSRYILSFLSTYMASLLIATATALVNGVIGDEFRIKSVDEFIDFSKSVSKGTGYAGSTVFLDSDIDFTGKSSGPIGTSYLNYFRGVFDGQGYVISNLNITSSSEYAGLFGYSTGLTIKNALLDSSCSIASASGSECRYIGGIIGHCNVKNGACFIENSVNMASITFNGDILSSYDMNLNLGGIAGQFYITSSGYESAVKNCVNYGDITHSGRSCENSYIGGIIGYSRGAASSEAKGYIYNSLNYGSITNVGSTWKDLCIGGIAGETQVSAIVNCVSAGKITSDISETTYIGSIVGMIYSTSVDNCYFTSDLNDYGKYGVRTPLSESNTFSYDSTTFELNGTVSVGTYTGNSLIDALNAYPDYYTFLDYSDWILNKNRNYVSFTINGRSPFILNSQVILTPRLADEGSMTFVGWYEDSGLTKPLTSHKVTKDTSLYGVFEVNTNNYTIFFDTKRGFPIEPISAPFNSVVQLPSEPIREHCSFLWWENKYGENVGLNFTIPDYNVTFYASWKCTRLETSEDFISFSKLVNNGMDSFNGSTVFLDSDIDLTNMAFEPIGKSISSYFLGAFDGQGHMIRNLIMNTTSSHYAGLFGYSTGLTIKNIILDSSCSIAGSNTYSDSNVGGIIGNCISDNGPCTIENNVNMGTVIYSDLTGHHLNIGGIAGYLNSYSSRGYKAIVKNCVNYGPVIHSGTSWSSRLGGIVGHSDGSAYSSSHVVLISNCINYGTIAHSGTSSNVFYLGGIVGEIEYTTIENCVSSGKISSDKTSYDYIGSIGGHVSSGTAVNYCYITDDLSYYNRYGYSTPTNESYTLNYDKELKLSETVSVGKYKGKSLVDALNGYANYYAFGDYSHWLLNKERNAATFTINWRTSFTLKKQVILMPSLASDKGMEFDGWYEDRICQVPFKKTTIDKDVTLYARYDVDESESTSFSLSLMPSFSFFFL